MSNLSFYSKILLFGEYGVIKNSKALSIPFDTYQGMLKIPTPSDAKNTTSNEQLQQFKTYLSGLNKDEQKTISLDLKAFQKDIDHGIYFDSSIPQGYGVGSSGALVAAVYSRYAFYKIKAEDSHKQSELNTLKSIFSIMESYFHGNSSGLDPLNSYLSIPILINSQKHLEVLQEKYKFEISPSDKGAIFLIDSKQIGHTSLMVNEFLTKIKDLKFLKIVKEQFVGHTDQCIDSFLKRDFNDFFSSLGKLSKVVFDNFKPMIPDKFHALWKRGIDTGDYYLKLCGSGGGGYILGFTKDIQKTSELLKDYPIKIIHNF